MHAADRAVQLESYMPSCREGKQITLTRFGFETCDRCQRNIRSMAAQRRFRPRSAFIEENVSLGEANPREG